MEIKIKNSNVRNPHFLAAIERLLQSRSMPAKTCLEVNRIIDETVSHHNILKRSRRDITMRLCSKDKDGQALLDESNNVVFPDAALNEECNKQFTDLDNEYLTVEMSNPVIIYEDENIIPLDLRLLGGLVEVKERPKE